MLVTKFLVILREDDDFKQILPSLEQVTSIWNAEKNKYLHIIVKWTIKEICIDPFINISRMIISLVFMFVIGVDGKNVSSFN